MRPLRRGTRNPKPGAVFKGCPRPEALRFSSLSGGGEAKAAKTMFGDGHYSQNIIQGGVTLQPQDYLLDGVTPLSQCIVVSSAAIVSPNAKTGAAVFLCSNLVCIGPFASLSPPYSCKGLIGFVRGTTALRSGARLHMDKLGKAGNFGNLSPDMLLPEEFRSHVVVDQLKAYVVLGEGAAGGAYSSAPNDAAANGNPGAAAKAFQTGGGGTGGTYASGRTGPAGKGGPCCGGAGSGGSLGGNGGPAGAYGGPGGNGITDGSLSGGGGAGDPPGYGTPNAAPGHGPGGGLLMLFSQALTIGTGAYISATGAQGGTGACGGGSAGGGCICLVTAPNKYSNAGTVSAAGGASIGQNGAAGGTGSVNILTKEAT